LWYISNIIVRAELGTDIVKKKIIITEVEAGKRLDALLVDQLENRTRSQIKRWIEEGDVRVGKEIKKVSYKVKCGENILIDISEPKEAQAEPQKIPINIIYEDSEIVVVNKAPGMVVHPAAGNPDGTLVNALLYHCKDLSGIGGVLRPGIVHRLDKGTSGVIIAAKNDRAHVSLSAQFKERKVKKIYKALIYGSPKEKKGTFSLDIGRHPTNRKKMSTKVVRGRSAVTHWEVVERFSNCLSLVKIRLITGRTHQIRVHFSANGMPLVGDSVYGGKRSVKRLPEGDFREIAAGAERTMLHASKVTILHPSTGKEMEFEADLPSDFKEILEGFRAVSR
jgi:23S rRNA pseudouridine1911/1915/1917 synthase